MALDIFGFSLSVTWTLVISIVLLFLIYDTWCHTFWRRHGFSNLPSLPIIGCQHHFSKGLPNFFLEGRKKYGKVFGCYAYRQPVLIVSDPDMLRFMLIKNFIQFNNRTPFAVQNKEFELNVSTLRDDHWKRVRGILTPVFSAGKMKQMAPLVNDCADRMIENMGKKQGKNGYIECTDLYGAFVTDTISSCAFGLHIDSQADPQNPFVDNTRRAFQGAFKSTHFILATMFPILRPVFKFFKKGLIPNDCAEFFRDVFLKAAALRRSSSRESQAKKVDFLQLMIDAQDNHKDTNVEEDKKFEQDVLDRLDQKDEKIFHASNRKIKTPLTDDEMVAQALIFFLAGYESTPTLLSFASYLLAMNPEVQEKLIREVDEIAPTRESSGYSSIAKMTYLDQVCYESLRVYPPVPMTERECPETCTYKNITIPKGIRVFVSIYGIHHDPDIWPEPEKFDPERFAKGKREKHHPCSWLPFSAGPRTCLGMRFALLAAKIAIVRMLQKYRFETCPQTEIPPQLGRGPFLIPPTGITLRIIPRTDI